jgi:hypothetical protein
LCYGSFFRRKDAFDLIQPKVLQKLVGSNSANLAEGSRQSALVQAGYAAQICHVHERSYICARDLLETIDDPSISFGSLLACGRAFMHAHRGNTLEAKEFSSGRRLLKLIYRKNIAGGPVFSNGAEVMLLAVVTAQVRLLSDGFAEAVG